MNKVAKATVALMIATIVAKVLGFGRELVLASSYGTSMYSDAYLTAMNIPIVIFASIGAALGTTFIPMYCDINNSLGEEEALKFTNNMFNLVATICLLLAIMGFIFAKPLVKVFAFGFKAETFEIAVNFTKILIVGIVFTGLSFIMTAYLQVKNNFIIPGIVSVPKNIIIILSILLSITYGPYIMIWGTVVGMATEFIFQIPFAIKEGYKYNLYVNIKDEYIKKAAWLIIPVIIGVGVNQVNAMIDRTLASTLVEGSISSLNYANKLNGFVMGLFITSISTVIYPILSNLSLDKNRGEFTNSVVQGINTVVLLVTPISIGAMVLATPIVRLLFQRGEFDERATNMTAIALIMYSIGMIAFGLREVLGKVFYSLHDTKTPMINGVMTMVINIVFNLILIKYLKHAGLALGTSLSSILGIIFLFKSLNKKIGYFGQDKILKIIFKSIIAAIIMGFSTYLTYKISNDIVKNEVITLIVSIIVGALTYGISALVLKIEEVNIIINILKNKKNKEYKI
ncbi:murein biosynthesis integral membrane protein MurJ [Romboutsia lituseburensis]|uniref:murein biosynthesis integral membrane protein MurJ n=1 Tax=Romboutsia lituseburensis TaxID=1537 RepID=UPI0022EAC984|nr:murein biosynthesis integral membrane protein MurJ [Romboutsia lituseburensis]